MADGVLINRSQDKRLDQFLYKAYNKLQKASSEPVTAMMVMALFVSEACGRSSQAPKDMYTRCQKHLERVRREASGRPVLLGSLLGDASGAKKENAFLGVGLARHRALLFKVLADSLDDSDTFSTLECDERKVAAWNTVTLNGAEFIVDVLLDPGALYEAGSAKHQEYVRLADPGHLNATRFDTISCRADLRGLVPRPCWHVEPKDLLCGRNSGDTLGRGGFGEVFRGIWQGGTVAVKVVKVKEPTDYEVLDFLLEIALLARLSHPNVMRFWRGCVELDEGRRSLLLVTEFVERGGLSSLLHGYGGRKLTTVLSMQQNLWLAFGIAQGTHYLHACKVLHLDLKSPNVLIDSSWVPKICDFGLAKISAASEGAQAFKTTIRGVSPIWAPPEMFDDEAGGMTDKADVYSYGIILYEIFFRCLPYQEVGMKGLPQAKYDGLLPLFPRDAPEDCAALLRKCYARTASTRPSMALILTRLRELAKARGLSLVDVVMPSWEDELVSPKEKKARGSAPRGEPTREQAHAARLRGAERAAKQKQRIERLAQERRDLVSRLKQARERRRQMQIEHLGMPLLTGEKDEWLGGNEHEVAAESSAVDANAAQNEKAKSSKRACCRIL